jgi:type IV secretion system protein VirD4
MKKLLFKSATLNALDFIDKDSSLALDDCRDLGKALVVRTGQEKDPHWCDGAEIWIAGIAAAVVQFGQGEQRSLQAVCDILTNPQKMDMARKLMQESDAWGGMLARIGYQLTHFRGDELGSILTTVGRFLAFLSTPAMAENTRASSFDPAGLRDGKMTVYLVLPPDRMKAQSGWLRSTIGVFLRAVIRGGLQETSKVHFILDEASALGQMDQIAEILAIGRAFSIRLQFYYQDCGQLKKCWPDGQDQGLLANTTQIFFGVNDQQTAEYVSARLGEETIVVSSGGTSRGGSRSASEGGQYSVNAGTSWNENANWAQQARKLLKPEEVAALSPRMAITFCPGMPPVWTTLLRYYEEPWLLKPVSWFGKQRQAFTALMKSLMMLFWSVLLAWFVTQLVMQHARPASPLPAQRLDSRALPVGGRNHP